MPQLAFVEKKIAVIEGFAVTLRYSGRSKAKGRDVRSDRLDRPTYWYRRKLKGDATVASWVKSQFDSTFPGYAVDVLDGTGKAVSGRTKLSTVRASDD